MRTTRLLRTGLLVVAASLPLTLAACGDDDTDVSSGGDTTVPSADTTAPGGDTSPDTTAPSGGAPGTVPDTYDWTWYGLTKAEAEAQAQTDGYAGMRIIREDDETFALTDDLQEGRVNVNIDDGIVTWAEVERLDGNFEREGAVDPADLEYLGLTETEAGAQADAAGRAWRVVSRDGEGLAVTMDYSPERLNFTVQDDVVIAVTRG